MKYKISPDRKTLTITADELERTELRELGEDVHQDRTMHDWLEPLVCNSELEWIDPSETGDLTSAPMLGIRHGGEPASRYDVRTGQYIPTLNGVDISPTSFDVDRAENISEQAANKITCRYAFMDYQVRSILEDLRDTGECVFVGGDL